MCNWLNRCKSCHLRCQPFSTKKSSLLIGVHMYGVFWWHINDIIELWHPHDTNKVVVMWMHHSIKNKVFILKISKVWWIFPKFSNFFSESMLIFFQKYLLHNAKIPQKQKEKKNTTSKLDKLILWFKHPFFVYFLFYYNGFYYRNLASSTFQCWIIILFWDFDVKKLENSRIYFLSQYFYIFKKIFKILTFIK